MSNFVLSFAFVTPVRIHNLISAIRVTQGNKKNKWKTKLHNNHDKIQFTSV